MEVKNTNTAFESQLYKQTSKLPPTLRVLSTSTSFSHDTCTSALTGMGDEYTFYRNWLKDEVDRDPELAAALAHLGPLSPVRSPSRRAGCHPAAPWDLPTPEQPNRCSVNQAAASCLHHGASQSTSCSHSHVVLGGSGYSSSGDSAGHSSSGGGGVGHAAGVRHQPHQHEGNNLRELVVRHLVEYQQTAMPQTAAAVEAHAKASTHAPESSGQHLRQQQQQQYLQHQHQHQHQQAGPMPALPAVQTRTTAGSRKSTDSTRSSGSPTKPDFSVSQIKALRRLFPIRHPKPKPAAAMPSEYQVLDIIGKGAFGCAYKARHMPTGRMVCIKTLVAPKGAAQAEALRAQRREVAVLAALALHPNIVRYHECFASTEGDESKLQLVMELVDGGDMATLIERHHKARTYMAEDTLLAYFVQLVAALAHVHSVGIMHRDVKANNIFLTSGGLLKLGDFGISKVLGSSGISMSGSRPTSGAGGGGTASASNSSSGASGLSYARGVFAHSFVGTPNYLAPETVSCEGYGLKADIWAAGCVLYEMAALKPAFRGKHIAMIYHLIRRGKTAPLPSVYSKGLHNLQRRMMARDPNDRPSSSELLHDELLRPHVANYYDMLQQLKLELPRHPLAGPSDGSCSLGSSCGALIGRWSDGSSEERITRGSSNGSMAVPLATGTPLSRRGSLDEPSCRRSLDIRRRSVDGRHRSMDNRRRSIDSRMQLSRDVTEGGPLAARPGASSHQQHALPVSSLLLLQHSTAGVQPQQLVPDAAAAAASIAAAAGPVPGSQGATVVQQDDAGSSGGPSSSGSGYPDSSDLNSCSHASSSSRSGHLSTSSSSRSSQQGGSFKITSRGAHAGTAGGSSSKSSSGNGSAPAPAANITPGMPAPDFQAAGHSTDGAKPPSMQVVQNTSAQQLQQQQPPRSAAPAGPPCSSSNTSAPCAGAASVPQTAEWAAMQEVPVLTDWNDPSSQEVSTSMQQQQHNCGGYCYTSNNHHITNKVSKASKLLRVLPAWLLGGKLLGRSSRSSSHAGSSSSTRVSKGTQKVKNLSRKVPLPATWTKATAAKAGQETLLVANVAWRRTDSSVSDGQVQDSIPAIHAGAAAAAAAGAAPAAAAAAEVPDDSKALYETRSWTDLVSEAGMNAAALDPACLKLLQQAAEAWEAASSCSSSVRSSIDTSSLRGSCDKGSSTGDGGSGSSRSLEQQAAEARLHKAAAARAAYKLWQQLEQVKLSVDGSSSNSGTGLVQGDPIQGLLAQHQQQQQQHLSSVPEQSPLSEVPDSNSEPRCCCRPEGSRQAGPAPSVHSALPLLAAAAGSAAGVLPTSAAADAAQRLAAVYAAAAAARQSAMLQTQHNSLSTISECSEALSPRQLSSVSYISAATGRASYELPVSKQASSVGCSSLVGDSAAAATTCARRTEQPSAASSGTITSSPSSSNGSSRLASPKWAAPSSAAVTAAPPPSAAAAVAAVDGHVSVAPAVAAAAGAAAAPIDGDSTSEKYTLSLADISSVDGAAGSRAWLIRAEQMAMMQAVRRLKANLLIVDANLVSFEA